MKTTKKRVQKRQKSKNSSLQFVNSIKGFIPVYSNDDKDAVITHYDVCIQSQAVSVGSLRKNARTNFISVSTDDVNTMLDHLELDIESDFEAIGTNEDFYCIYDSKTSEITPIPQTDLIGCEVNIGGVATEFTKTNQLQVFQELQAGFEYRQYELKNGEFAGLWACSNEMLNSNGVHCITKNGHIEPIYISLRVMWSDTVIDGNRVADTRPNSILVDGKKVVLDGGGLPFGDSTVNEALEAFELAEETSGWKYSKDIISATDVVKMYIEEELYPKTLVRCAEDEVFSAEENEEVLSLVSDWIKSLDEESDDDDDDQNQDQQNDDDEK